jgi:hypothetical protein
MSGCAKAPPSGDLNPGDMSVSGRRETANGFVVNGSSVQEDFNMYAAVVPNLDSIQEFRVLTSNFDAEYGNFSGGQIVVTTKSGASDLHGSAYDFARNKNLAARNFFAPERAKYDRQQFGGTFGGAIRKNRRFRLFSGCRGEVQPGHGVEADVGETLANRRKYESYSNSSPWFLKVLGRKVDFRCDSVVNDQRAAQAYTRTRSVTKDRSGSIEYRDTGSARTGVRYFTWQASIQTAPLRNGARLDGLLPSGRP